MIIECISCSKKFDVDSELIPSSGRTIQCGACSHIWFYKKDPQNQLNPTKIDVKKDESAHTENIDVSKISLNKTKKIKKISIKDENSSKRTEIVKYKPKSNFTLGRFLSYLLVTIITLIAIILLLDTFKLPLYDHFPKLEFFLFNLYETLKDIQLFIKDLI